MTTMVDLPFCIFLHYGEGSERQIWGEERRVLGGGDCCQVACGSIENGGCLCRFGNHDVVANCENGWKQQLFYRIKAVFGYGA
jgi:hypothetical protein